MIEPGLVRPGGDGLITVQKHPRLAPLIEMLQTAGFSVQQVPDLSSLIWGKLVINAAINPLTALLGVPNGKLLQSQSARELMEEAAREAAQVATAHGIKLNFKNPAQAAAAVARATSDNLSSMLQDIHRGAPTEIEVISGAVTRLGREVNIPTPVNQVLWQLIQARVELIGNLNHANS